jgi:hypothetical protein
MYVSYQYSKYILILVSADALAMSYNVLWAAVVNYK